MNDTIHIIKSDYVDALNLFKNNNIKSDIVFLDPPYKLNLIQNCLNTIEKYDLLSELHRPFEFFLGGFPVKSISAHQPVSYFRIILAEISQCFHCPKNHSSRHRSQ